MISRLPAVLAVSAMLCPQSLGSDTWDDVVLPPEQTVEVDPTSGAQVVFVTTHPGSYSNFYFHERCFLHDNRMMRFNSDRFGRSEAMGSLLDTDELIRLSRPGDSSLGSRVASVKGDRLYAIKSGGICEWRLELNTTPETRVRITERKQTDLPDGVQQRSSLDENCDGSLLAFAPFLGGEHYIGFLDIAAGVLLPPAKIGFKLDHLQFHRNRPEVVAASRTYDTGGDWAPVAPADPTRARIWTVNLRMGAGWWPTTGMASSRCSTRKPRANAS
jgi:hypothetical protein